MPILRRLSALLRRPAVRRVAGALASALVAEWARSRTRPASPPARGPRRLSDGALAQLLGFEGFSATWYKNGPADRWTIGYGTTEGVVPGLIRAAVPGPISEAEARRWMAQVVDEVVAPAVLAAVTVPLTQGQFDALVLFAYNVGAAALRSSTLLKKLNAGDVGGAAAEFDRWVYSGKTVLPGLVARRRAERRRFEG